MSCGCECGKRVALKGVLTKSCSRKGLTPIGLEITKAQPRRLADPDGREDKYMHMAMAMHMPLHMYTYKTAPKELKLTGSKKRIGDQEDINLVQDMLREDGHWRIHLLRNSSAFDRI